MTKQAKGKMVHPAQGSDSGSNGRDLTYHDLVEAAEVDGVGK